MENKEGKIVTNRRYLDNWELIGRKLLVVIILIVGKLIYLYRYIYYNSGGAFNRIITIIIIFILIFKE